MAAKKNNRLLLVEDDESLGYLLSEYLKIKDFQVVWARSGKDALTAIEKEVLDLIILDIMLPDLDGFSLAGKIKQLFPELPFIFLTARSLKVDVLKGFSLGAVDYLKKPIDEEELVARIQNLLDRLTIPGPRKEEVQTIGKYSFNSKSQELGIEGKTIPLTARENELLLYLSQNRNQLCSHKDILNLLWGKNDYFNRKSLNVFIFHLRKYLSQDPNIRIDNIHRKGFILRIEE